MKRNNRPKVLICEPQTAVAAGVEAALTSEGWQVILASDPDMVFSNLKNQMENPFALVVWGLGPEGDPEGLGILESVRDISPMSQRMLWLPDHDPQLLVEAVNTAGIQACMTYPVDPLAFKEQAVFCLEQFEKDVRRAQFKQLITTHNQKMFRIARNLKKKDNTNRLLLDEKKSNLSRLEYKYRSRRRKKEQKENISISSLVAHRGEDKNPDFFSRVFSQLCSVIEAKIQGLAGEQGVEWTTAGPLAAIENEDLKHLHPEVVDALIKKVCLEIWESDLSLEPDPEAPFEPDEDGQEDDLEKSIEDYLELIIDERGVNALLKKSEEGNLPDFVDLAAVNSFLQDQDISFGRVEDAVLEKWMETKGTDSLVVARAKLPELCRNGEITYHFENNRPHPGELRPDGSIDFRVRGEVPFVEKGVLLAEKQEPVFGKTGINVFGDEIYVEEPLDPPFLSGHGTQISEDGKHIFAAADGEPHVDPLGTITVNPEFVVDGDVDFQTGNIDFKGSIVVKGTIKQGFSVTGVNLTANEIEGAVISLSGDLIVGSGITGATIKTVGNIFTKFIHNSTILGFCDFSVEKEIIDSDILISGRCIMPRGHIIATSISAKNGIESGKIGTPASRPPILKVGSEKHIVAMVRKTQYSLKNSLEQIEAEQENIEAWKEEDLSLEAVARKKARVQEACLEKISLLKKKYLGEKGDKELNPEERKDLTVGLKLFFVRAKKAETELKSIFERQDSIRQRIQDAEKRINNLEKDNIKWVDEKKYLVEYAKKGDADPSVIVNRSIIQGTRVQGCHSEIMIDEDRGACRIEEGKFKKDNRSRYEMIIQPLV